MTSGPQVTPANSYLISTLGTFVVAWSVLDLLIDAAIIKQLNLDPKRGAIVTCGLGFEAKVGMLSSLLHLSDPEYADVIRAIDEIKTQARRNVLLHGYISIGDAALEFTKMDAKSKLTVRSVKHAPEHFNEVLGIICRKTDYVADRLGITLADREAIVNIGKSMANKAPTSPTSSSQKRT